MWPRLTAEECKCVRVALSLGMPDTPHEPLESAMVKLHAMESAAQRALMQSDELFVAEWGARSWVFAESRSADEALALVASFDGPIHGDLSVSRVRGRIEDQGGAGPWFHLDADGEHVMWEVVVG